MPRAARAYDLAVLDPPFGSGLAAPAITRLAAGGWLAPGALVVIEKDQDEPDDEFPGLSLIDRRSYGRITFSFFAAGSGS
jgi:16S rRNA (guanine966-N2)-methyltransferase